jgi:hypothetical protein
MAKIQRQLHVGAQFDAAQPAQVLKVVGWEGANPPP